MANNLWSINNVEEYKNDTLTVCNVYFPICILRAVDHQSNNKIFNVKGKFLIEYH